MLPPPPGTIPVNVTFGDHSGSHSEKYRVKLEKLAGDPSGPAERYRTNRSFGDTQTDTFRLPPGSKYKVTLEHWDTDPDYDGDPNPDYDHELEFETPEGFVFVDDPQGIAGQVNGNETFTAAGKSATLFIPKFLPGKISFSNSSIGDLTSDDVNTTYDAPHWEDSNEDGDADDSGERKYPVAYVRKNA